MHRVGASVPLPVFGVICMRLVLHLLFLIRAEAPATTRGKSHGHHQNSKTAEGLDPGASCPLDLEGVCRRLASDMSAFCRYTELSLNDAQVLHFTTQVACTPLAIFAHILEFSCFS